MSQTAFTKGVCRQCGGHLEFPAEALGQTIDCPHCGQPTDLVPSVSTGRRMTRRLALVLAVILVLTGLVVVVWFGAKSTVPVSSEVKTNPVPPVAVANVSNTVRIAAAAPPLVELKPGEQRTNDFLISPVKLDKTPGSSLVYVTGKVRNLSDRQRFGVKIEFELLDTNNETIGTALDQQTVLEPHGEWQFKAMIMKSKAVAARFDSIGED